MQSQTLTQTITLLVGDAAAGGGTLASTGMSLSLILAIVLIILTLGTALWFFTLRRPSSLTHRLSHRSSRRLSLRSLLTPLILAASITSLGVGMHLASAAPTLTIASSQSALTLTIPKGGGTATTTTTMTTSTANATGYTLTASLEAEELGIGIALKGGDVTTNTALAAGETPLTLKSTNTANTGDATDTTAVELSFTIDSTVTEGTKELKLTYKATDNESAGPVTPPTPTTMQSLTQDYCTNHMTIYNGTNEDAILTLQDNRGATPADYRTYQVAKLADNKCWMLDNLKLGSTTGTTTLTSADSNVSSNFILPQVQTGGSVSYDTPTVSGPVPGDTGNGATNYGYLYNWSAATAGETQASITSGNAAHSICARGWRLPTGGTGGDFAQLDQAFGGPGTGSSSGEANIAQWQHSGPFKGVFAGVWWEGFYDQGDWGNLWSSSAYPDWSGSAFNANFNADNVNPGNNNNRNNGFGVRCLLN